jgi:hypothetical protein
MTPSSQTLESPGNPGRFTLRCGELFYQVLGQAHCKGHLQSIFCHFGVEAQRFMETLARMEHGEERGSRPGDSLSEAVS